MLCRDTLSSVDDIEEGLDLPTVSPGSLSRAPRSPVLQSPSTMQHPLNCVSILVILLVTVLDLLLQLSTLRCSWLTFPTYFGINETQNVKEYGQLGGGWICVYVPEGTNPNKPFPDYSTGQSSYTLYEPNQNVLGSGTWLEGGAYSQTNNRSTIINQGVVDTSRYSDTPLVTTCASVFLCPASSTLVMLSGLSSGCLLLLALYLLSVWRILPSQLLMLQELTTMFV